MKTNVLMLFPSTFEIIYPLSPTKITSLDLSDIKIFTVLYYIVKKHLIIFPIVEYNYSVCTVIIDVMRSKLKVTAREYDIQTN